VGDLRALNTVTAREEMPAAVLTRSMSLWWRRKRKKRRRRKRRKKRKWSLLKTTSKTRKKLTLKEI
jgi:3-methyladenine DNA glycosylase Mpg